MEQVQINKPQPTPMELLTANYEKFIAGKETNKTSSKAFDKTLEKAVKPRGSK